MHVSDPNRTPSLVLSGRQVAAINAWYRTRIVLATMTLSFLFGACATKPIIPVLGRYAADGSRARIPGRGRGLQSLSPATRKAWLAQYPLPDELPYYSIATFTPREHISSILAKPTR